MGLKLASATDRAIGRPSELAQTYQAAGQFEQALMEIGASFVAGAEPFELGQIGRQDAGRTARARGSRSP